MLFCLVGCAQKVGESVPTQKEEKTEETPVVEESKVVDITFAAVGDNLIHGAVYEGANVGGGYDFSRYYEHTNKITQNVDVAYVNQETPFAGVEFGLQSYPSFNGPKEILDGLYSAGFDWVNMASNHTLDMGVDGILSELSYAEKYAQEMTLSGAYASEEARNETQIITRDGVDIGVLSYTYGLNGYALPSGYEYMISIIDEEKIIEEVERLKQDSDIQIVSMHWGDEYSFTQNAQQEYLAQLLSDLGVDVIVGAHPHVIQPVDMLVGEEGNETLVFYSLGNFLSAQDVNYRMLGLMPTWTISYDEASQEVIFKDVNIYPTVTYINSGLLDYRTYLLQDYTNDIASSHYIGTRKGQDVSKEYFINLATEVLGTEFSVIY